MKIEKRYFVELIIILFCVINIFRPTDKYEFYNKDEYQDIVIGFGSYKTVVEYAFAEDSSVAYGDSLGAVEFKSKKCKELLKAGVIQLTKGNTKKEQDIWILCKLKDLSISAPDNNDALQIQRIIIEENNIFRYTTLGMVILCIILVEILIRYYNNIFLRYELNDKLLIIGLILMCILASLPALDNVIWIGHDIYYHIARINSIAHELSYGQFPIYIYSDMLNEYGYVSPVFYNDCFLYLPAFLYLLKIPMSVCYNVYIIIINICTVSVSYFSFKNITHNKKYAFFATALYVLNIYRINNIYTRSAVGEYTAMMFLPLIIMGIYNIYKTEKVNVYYCILTILGLTGIVKSHVLSVMIVGVFMFLFCLINIKQTLQIQRFISLVGIAITTFIVNFDFILPFIDSGRMDLEVLNKTNKIQHKGAYISHLLNPLSQGYGTNGVSMSLSLGLGILIGLTIIIVYILIWNNVNRNAKLVFELGILAMIMATRYFPWDALSLFGDGIMKIFGAVQFPWRYLSIAGIMITLAITWTYIDIEKRNGQIAIILFTITLCAAILSVFDFYGKAMDEIEMTEILSDSEILMSYVGSGEYLIKNTDEDLLKDKRIICDDNIVISSYEKKGDIRELNCKNISDKVGSVILPVLNYDNYVVVDYDNDINFEMATGDNNRMCLELMAGYDGKISIEYHPKLIWKLAYYGSYCVLAVLIFSTLLMNKKVVFRKL